MPLSFAEIEKFNKIVRKEFKYPKDQLDLQSKVSLKFVVKTDGSIDREGLRILGLVGKWRPGKCNGKLVPVRIQIPLIFELEK